MNSIQLFLDANINLLEDYVLLNVKEGHTCFFVCDDDNLDKLDDNIYHDSGGNFWLQPRLIGQSELAELKEQYYKQSEPGNIDSFISKAYVARCNVDYKRKNDEQLTERRCILEYNQITKLIHRIQRDTGLTTLYGLARLRDSAHP